MSREPRTLAIQPTDRRAIQAPRRALVDDLARRSTFALLRNLSRGSVYLVDGDEYFTFGRRDADLSSTVTVHDPGLYRAVAFGGSVGAAEAYMKGQWTCNDLPSLTRIVARNLDTFDALDAGAGRWSRRLARVLTTTGRRNTRAGSRRNIARHYDLSNELFALFLDESMTYSSALFDRDDTSLGDAQFARSI